MRTMTRKLSIGIAAIALVCLAFGWGRINANGHVKAMADKLEQAYRSSRARHPSY